MRSPEVRPQGSKGFSHFSYCPLATQCWKTMTLSACWYCTNTKLWFPFHTVFHNVWCFGNAHGEMLSLTAFVSSPVPGASLTGSNRRDWSRAGAKFCDMGEIRILNRQTTDQNVAVEDLQLWIPFSYIWLCSRYRPFKAGCWESFLSCSLWKCEIDSMREGLSFISERWGK